MKGFSRYSPVISRNYLIFSSLKKQVRNLSKQLEDDIDEWLRKFEYLLSKLHALSVKIIVENELNDDQITVDYVCQLEKGSIKKTWIRWIKTKDEEKRTELRKEI